jgi:agmatine deiminase
MPRKKFPDQTKTSEPQLPAALGFWMPAEWEKHEATWIAWPFRRSDWPGKLPTIPWVYGEIIRWIHRGERVNILVNDAKSERQADHLLKRVGVDLQQITFWRWPTDRVWTRDYGPTFLSGPDGKRALLDWQFNAWAKYPDWKNDDAIPASVAEALGLRAWQPMFDGERIVLEGGAIDVNGQGMLLASEECLLGEVQARNPGITRDELEQTLGDYLGIKRVLWLNRGIAGDDTHGHIDDLARFVGVRTVVAVEENNPEDENYEPLCENLERLNGMTDLEDRPFEVITLPMPQPLYFDGQRLPASYANFYIANSVVLVPTFNDPNDRVALGVLSDLFPGRKVVGIHAVDLLWGLGTIHCMTQQEPAAITSTESLDSPEPAAALPAASPRRRRGSSRSSTPG